MFPLPQMRSFRANMFWRHFANYFVLILIPVIAASILAHVLVVRLIEEDARKLSDVVMSRFTEQTDTAFNALKTNMINMLSTSGIRSLLKESGDSSPENRQRSEMIHDLRGQLIKLQSSELVSKAYLVFAHHDLVIDGDTYTNKSYYFNIQHPLEDKDRTPFFALFSGKKMMSFVEPLGEDIPALMSYPFNTDAPEVYLVVNIRRDKLQNLIHVRQDWVAGTAIVGSGGQVLSQAGPMKEWNVAAQLASGLKNPQFNVAGQKAVSLVPSGFDDSWSYLSMIDMQTLMKPAEVTRLISWAFLLFFVLIGSIVSYHLSRRIYKPVMEIKEGLKSRRNENDHPRDGNDFDVIKRYSRLIVSENEQLSQLVSGMTPIVHEHFIAKILQGQYRDALSIETYAREIGFAYGKKTARTVLCIAFHYEREYEQLSESSKSFLMAELKERIRGLVPAALWLCQTKPDTLACIVHRDLFLQLNPEEEADIVKLALQLYGKYFKATIGIGSTVHAMEELHVSYEHALSVLQRRRLHSGVEICGQDSPPESARYDSYLSVQEVNRMLNQYKTREHDKLLQSAFEVLDEGVRVNATAMQVKHLCSDILNTWIRAVETERKDFHVPFYAGLFDTLNRCMTIDELRCSFEEIHRLLFPAIEGKGEDKPKKLADILNYIHEHYDQELSIEYFAGTLNMSIGHFSRTFKEEVGEKYVEYIARYRLMKAKEMLLETDLKIDDIAEKVGYWGRNSFIRMFRKYEGITPAKYRTLHQQ
ncbi:helix-turn-helix domain-containing protein [Paenibacillus sp. DMB20]|uniref:helix-turn-helix domain-containing protein n=1 Tax=Paenibacillus sp. DMB20 TaxID=1642570 RepID=UPI000627938F|nr:helix-turn-helix domain-containing protein [Paenibacillus sp. DMB20]KKO54401.1 AraC family transcriptional regulator [Paenibacillus sp. DMB20]